MNEMVGWIAFFALLIACLIAVAVLCIRRKRRLERLWLLHKEAAAFLAGGKKPDFSVGDEEEAFLRNDIAELASELERARDHERAFAEQTAGIIADISHQLKTPLAGMRLYCEMDAEDGSPGALKQLSLIDHMEKLVLRLLRLEKLKASAYEMTFAPGDLFSLCRAEAQRFSELFPQKKIRVEGGACMARFDADWMAEAIGNIIKNACEHTSEDGVISIYIAQREDFIWLSVEDDGGGVPEAKLPMLFSRFSRVSAQGANSCGLGLAITRSIMECHHGGALAENGARGLRVSLYLPIIADQMSDMSMK